MPSIFHRRAEIRRYRRPRREIRAPLRQRQDHSRSQKVRLDFSPALETVTPRASRVTVSAFMDFTNLIARKQERFSELEEAVGSSELFSDPKRAQDVLREHSQLRATLDKWAAFQKAERELAEKRGARRRRRRGDGRTRRGGDSRSAGVDSEARTRSPDRPPASRARRGQGRDRGNSRRHWRHRSGAFCRGPLSHVFPLRRNERLEARDAREQFRRSGRLQGNHLPAQRRQRLSQDALRERPASCPACARHGSARPHSHVGGDRGRAARSRGGRSRHSSG